MALIQCSSTWTALDWYKNLRDTYKKEWNSFIQLIKNNSLLKNLHITHK